MKYRYLPGTDVRVSVIGFGASPLGNEFGEIDPAQGERAVRHAIDRGINFFDVSPYYGRTLAEQRLGAALAGRRHEVVLATKCGRYGPDSFEFSGDRVIRSAEESLKRLRTGYLDILQAHDIEFGNREQIIGETIPALRKLKEQGKVRLIGVTGLPLKLLADVAIRGGVDLVLSYCRHNLLIRDLDAHLSPALKERGIGLLNASPFLMGILTERGAPPWHPAPDEVKWAGKRIVEFCRKRGVSATQCALRFCLDHPYVSSTFVGMAATDDVDANLKALETPLDPMLLEEIEMLAGQAMNMTWRSGLPNNQD